MKNGRNHQSTPQDLFDWANARWGPFTLDACAAEWNAKVSHYYNEETNGLTAPWAGRVWCNPPWNDIAPWAVRAMVQAAHEPAVERAVMLLPARAGRPWWHYIVAPSARIHPIGRVRFLPPPGEPVGHGGFEDAVFAVFEAPYPTKKKRGKR